MPVIKSAKKKLKQDKVRQLANKKIKIEVKDAIKEARLHPSEKHVQAAFSLIDKAAKHRIFHENKAARQKSSLAKLLVKKEVKKISPAAPVKTSIKKSPKK